MTQPSRHLDVMHAAGAGIATGMRSNSALAAASAAAHRGDLATGNGWADRLVRWRGTTLVFGLATAGELVVDKLPIAPSRLEPGPLLGRVVLGGLAGAIVSRGRGGSPIIGLLAGSAGAVVSTQVWGPRSRRHCGEDRCPRSSDRRDRGWLGAGGRVPGRQRHGGPVPA